MIFFLFLWLTHSTQKETYLKETFDELKQIYKTFDINPRIIMSTSKVMNTLFKVINNFDSYKLNRFKYFYIKKWNDHIINMAFDIIQEVYLLLTTDQMTMVRYIISLDKDILKNSNYMFKTKISCYKRILMIAYNESLLENMYNPYQLYSNKDFLKDTYCDEMKVFADKVFSKRVRLLNNSIDRFYKKIIQTEINYIILRLQTANEINKSELYKYSDLIIKYELCDKDSKFLIKGNEIIKCETSVLPEGIICNDIKIHKGNEKIIKALLLITFTNINLRDINMFKFYIEMLTHYNQAYNLSIMFIAFYPYITVVSLVGQNIDNILEMYKYFFDRTKEVNLYINRQIMQDGCYLINAISLESYSFKDTDGLHIGVKPCLKLICAHYLGCEFLAEWFDEWLIKCPYCNVHSLPVCYFEADVYLIKDVLY